jgi:hypothetical protein
LARGDDSDPNGRHASCGEHGHQDTDVIEHARIICRSY